MYTSTLRGIFPEQKPVCRRNFIKENVKSIKQMQGVLQEAGMIQPRKKTTNQQPKTINQQPKSTATVDKKKPSKKSTSQILEEENQRLTHRAMQTEREEDLSRLYDTGVIKYPSPGVGRTSKQPPQTGQGDHLTKPQKSQLPQNYQRGVLPKYLRDRKEESAIPEPDNECPSGHVLLPEEERKETLRVLRQSYADRIQELNMMPVRNDTLKMKKRKMEIEEELKRIDGGIKVFQRPKVYVKINA